MRLNFFVIYFFNFNLKLWELIMLSVFFIHNSKNGFLLLLFDFCANFIYHENVRCLKADLKQRNFIINLEFIELNNLSAHFSHNGQYCIQFGWLDSFNYLILTKILSKLSDKKINRHLNFENYYFNSVHFQI